MKPTRSVALLLALLAVLNLVACGNKGDLVRPATTPTETPATP